MLDPDGSNPVNLTNDSDRFDAWPTWSPDGEKLMYISDAGSDWPEAPDIFVMNADGSNPVNLTNNSSAWLQGHATWSPDGTQIAYEIYNPGGRTYDIWMMNADGTRQKNLTQTGSESEATVTWSPDGTQLAYLATSGGAPNIWVMNADGTNPINLTNDDQVTDVWPSWSGVTDLATLIEAISWGQLKTQNR